MEVGSVFKFFESVGSLGLIFLLIFKAPEIIASFQRAFESVMQNIIKVQAEQASANQKSIEMMMQKFDMRFVGVKEDMLKLLDTMEKQVQLLNELLHREINREA